MKQEGRARGKPFCCLVDWWVQQFAWKMLTDLFGIAVQCTLHSRFSLTLVEGWQIIQCAMSNFNASFAGLWLQFSMPVIWNGHLCRHDYTCIYWLSYWQVLVFVVQILECEPLIILVLLNPECFWSFAGKNTKKHKSSPMDMAQPLLLGDVWPRENGVGDNSTIAAMGRVHPWIDDWDLWKHQTDWARGDRPWPFPGDLSALLKGCHIRWKTNIYSIGMEGVGNVVCLL